MKIRTITINSIIAAVYVAVTFAIQPLAFGVIQFRLSEIINHFIVYNKKYFWGIVVGVFIANMFSPNILMDLTFGVGHTIISLLFTLVIKRWVKNQWVLMVLNAFIFSFMIFIVAIELDILAFSELPLMISWLYLFLSELIVMFIGMPVVYFINKRLNLTEIIEQNI